MKKATLFLNGSYKKNHLNYYQAKSRGSYTVAVDGGYQYFRKTNTDPDLLLGDFDSIKNFPKKQYNKIEIVVHPINKNKTDLELALELVIKRGYKMIEIIQPEVGEIDHFLGNLFFVFNQKIMKHIKKGLRLSFVHPEYRLAVMSNERMNFKDNKSDVISVFSVSSSIILSNGGFEYSANKQKINKGSSFGLRNTISSNRAFLEVEGQALIYQKYRQKS